jgi:hypothetical protein
MPVRHVEDDELVDAVFTRGIQKIPSVRRELVLLPGLKTGVELANDD